MRGNKFPFDNIRIGCIAITPTILLLQVARSIPTA